MTRILVFGAHPDDFEFAAGASIKKLIEEGNDVSAAIISDCTTIPGNENIKEELHASMKAFGIGYEVYRFETMFFHKNYQEIRNTIFRLKQTIKPELIISPSINAAHPDHKIVGESVRSIFLEQSVLYYEDIRGNHNQSINYWVPLEESHIQFKIAVLGNYTSQHKRSYFDFKAIEASALSRGLQIGRKFAEGFEVERIVRE